MIKTGPLDLAKRNIQMMIVNYSNQRPIAAAAIQASPGLSGILQRGLGRK